METGHYQEALEMARDAKAIWLKEFGPDHWRTASASATEGASLVGLKQFDEAEKLLLASYKVLHEERGAMKFYVTSSSRWLAKLYQAMGQPEKAGRYRQQG
jgi:serine/threonine-protein kinase